MKLFAPLFFLYFTTSSLHSNTQNITPREVLFSYPKKTAVALSPDGKHLAYLAPVDGILNVWIKSINQDDDRVLTQSKKSPVRSLTWSSNGQYLLFQSDNEGDENYYLFSLNIDTLEVINLTPYKNAQTTLLKLSDEYPNHALIMMNDRDPTSFDIYRINITNGQREQIYLNDQRFSFFLADDYCQVKAAIRMSELGIELCVRDNNESAFKTLKQYPLEESRDTSLISLSKEGDLLYFVDVESSDKKASKMLFLFGSFRSSSFQ